MKGYQRQKDVQKSWHNSQEFSTGVRHMLRQCKLCQALSNRIVSQSTLYVQPECSVSSNHADDAIANQEKDHSDDLGDVRCEM